ncbi:MAG: hypothetical protein Q8J79_03905 [Erythrobacter sp.]|nr:hypothetical protein [Erythrobacter sp.]
MKEALTARLLASAPLAAIFGTRMNWGRRVQGEGLPALTMNGVSPGRSYHYRGAAGLAGPRVQFDLYALDFLTAEQGARALVTTLEQPAVIGAIAFGPAFLDAERGPDTEDLGGGAQVQRISMDFFIWFSPAA